MLMEYIKRLKNLKIKLLYDPATPLLGVYKKIFKKAWNTNTKIYMHVNVQSSIVYNCQNMEVTKVLIKGWTDKEDSILLNHTHKKMKFLACGTFPYQGLNWCPLHCKADSTTGPPGKPHNFLFCWSNVGIQCCVCCRCCYCSVTKLCPTLCEPMDCSPPGSSVLYLPEFAQICVDWVGDAFSPSHPLSPPSPPVLSLSHHQSLFQWIGFSH